MVTVDGDREGGGIGMSTVEKIGLEQELLALAPWPKDQMTMKMRSLWYFGIEVLIYETTCRGDRINIEGVEYGTAEEAATVLHSMTSTPDPDAKPKRDKAPGAISNPKGWLDCQQCGSLTPDDDTVACQWCGTSKPFSTKRERGDGPC